MRPHQPSASVTKKYWVKYLLTQLRQNRPPMRRWKNITMAPMCCTNSTFRVGASTPQDWQIMKRLPSGEAAIINGGSADWREGAWRMPKGSNGHLFAGRIAL